MWRCVWKVEGTEAEMCGFDVLKIFRGGFINEIRYIGKNISYSGRRRRRRVADPAEEALGAN